MESDDAFSEREMLVKQIVQAKLELLRLQDLLKRSYDLMTTVSMILDVYKYSATEDLKLVKRMDSLNKNIEKVFHEEL